jgi:flagellar assembly protein FliH
MPPLKLEVFEAEPSEGIDSASPTALAIEEARIAAFEQGYSAGWEDAVAAQSDDQTRIRADLSRHLQALSFTYHEARLHLLRSLEPLLVEVATQILPPIAREALGPVILESLREPSSTLTGAAIGVRISPADRACIEPILASAGFPVELRDEPSLAEGQAYLSWPGAEARVDLAKARDDILAALRAFIETTLKETPNG